MERKLAILLISTLIIGLAGGFILNFIAYQPQIQNLRNDIVALKHEMSSYIAANEKKLAELNKTISNLNSVIKKLNVTSGAASENKTSTYEHLNVQAQATSNGTHFEINFGIINSGSAPAALILIYLQQYPTQMVHDVTSVVLNGTTFANDAFFNVPIPVGLSLEGKITLVKGLADGFNFQSDTVVQLRFTSSQRKDYLATVYLP